MACPICTLILCEWLYKGPPLAKHESATAGGGTGVQSTPQSMVLRHCTHRDIDLNVLVSQNKQNIKGGKWHVDGSNTIGLSSCRRHKTRVEEENHSVTSVHPLYRSGKTCDTVGNQQLRL